MFAVMTKIGAYATLRFGSLVFTGVDDDPETLATLARMGFANAARVSQTIRSWHHGHIPATRTERGREARCGRDEKPEKTDIAGKKAR